MGPGGDRRKQEGSSSSYQARNDPPPSDERPWSDLDWDVLGVIYDKLPLTNGVRFASVCRSWRNVGTSRPEPTFPLVMPPFRTSQSLLRSPFHNFVSLRYKFPEARRMPCRGAIGGWLFYCEFSEGKRPFFLDPTFKNPRIYLPPWRWNHKWPQWDAIISSVPTNSASCTVVFFFNKTIFHCKVNGEMWSSCQADANLNNSTGAFLSGKLHVIDENQRLGVVDFEDSKNALTWLSMDVGPLLRQFGHPWVYGGHFLVESSGTLLLAFLGQGWCWCVFRADLTAMTWRGVEDLRDRSLFLAPGGSVSAVAVEVGVEANRLYFARGIISAAEPAASWMSVAAHNQSNCWQELSLLRYGDQMVGHLRASRWVFERVAIIHELSRVGDEPIAINREPPRAGNEIAVRQRPDDDQIRLSQRLVREIFVGRRRSWFSCFPSFG